MRIRRFPQMTALAFCTALLLSTGGAQTKSSALQGPSNPKSQKAYDEAHDYLKQRMRSSAVESYKKAVKLDPQCLRCAKEGIEEAMSIGDNKDAWEMADMISTAAANAGVKEFADNEAAVAFYREGVLKNKKELLEKAVVRYDAALTAKPNDPSLRYEKGLALAHLNDDEHAKAEFTEFLKFAPENDPMRSRVARYIEQPELARARMAPNFRVTTLDGQTVTMDDLRGKVVLVDFWATWCGPCNAELPHVKEIAARYAGRPLVILSVSSDKDEAKWKQFIGAHGMTWLQARDSDQSIAEMFGIESIPHYFTIDTDGILQTEQLGGGSEIDGKLKKMVAQAEKHLQENAVKGGD